MKQFFLHCIQPERRLNLKQTTLEMFQVSSLLYGGISLIALFSLMFPTWPALDSQSIIILTLFGFIFSIVFYTVRHTGALWLAIIHIPIGVSLASISVYFGHSEQAVGFSIIYVISSAFLFHYITKTISIIILTMGMIFFALALKILNVEGWPSLVIFVAGNCFLMGLIVSRITFRMHQLSIKDSLTSLMNRQTIDALTTNLIETLKSDGTPFFFIVIDLNKFKHVNDTQGHLAGDKILIEFSRLLEKFTGENHYVARWGGDEFIVILNTNSQNELAHFEQSIRQSSKNLIEFELGVSCPEKGDTLDSLMHRADQSMYSNKHNRRVTDLALD